MNKKIILFLIIILSTLFMENISVSAEEYNEIISDIVSELEIDKIENSEVQDFFEENEVSIENPQSILNISFQDIANEVKQEFFNNFETPLKLFSTLMAVIVISSLTGNFQKTLKSGTSQKVFGIVCIMVAVTLISEPIKQCFYTSSESIKSGAVFMTVFTPVFSGITAVSGGVSASAVYSSMIFLASEISLQLADGILIPLLSMCMALSIVDAVNTSISLSELINGFKKLVTTVLGFIMLIFTGILSIQSLIGTSADNLSVKAGKYIISNFVPVVGGAVSDAYTTLRCSMGLLRTGVGSFGIITLVLMILPPVISAGLYYGVMKLAFIFSDMFGEKSLSRLFSDMSTVLSMVFGIMICFAMIMIISTTAVMLTFFNA